MCHNRSSITLTDSSLLRGTTAAVLLACFGRRLRSTAGGIGTIAIAEDEYNKSFVVPELDIFFSHSWHARWYLKYFTVLFYFNSVPAVVCSMSCACFSCGAHFLVENYAPSYVRLFPSYQCFALGTLAFFLCLFCWQHFLVTAGCGARSLFLDKVCIHQTDMVKKEQGIKAIGGILGHSDMVLVAWDPSYFTRLWCTFELAAYKYAKPEAPVVVLPITIGGFIFVVTVMQFFGEIAVAIVESHPLMADDRLRTYLTAYFAQSIVCSAVFRAYTKELQRLDYQLRNFSVRKAECFCCSNDHLLNGKSLPCDRKLVESSIAHWHGKDQLEVGLRKFNDLIRGTFRDDIKLAFRGSRVPYTFVLSTTIWAGLYQIDRMSTKGWASNKPEKWLEVMNSTFLLYPMSMAILINVCQVLFRLELDHRDLEAMDTHEEVVSWRLWSLRRFIDTMLAGVSTATVLIMIKVSYWVIRASPKIFNTLWPCVAFVFVEGLIVWLLYRRRRPNREAPPDLLLRISKRMSLESIFAPPRGRQRQGTSFRPAMQDRATFEAAQPLHETEMQDYKQEKSNSEGASFAEDSDQGSLNEGSLNERPPGPTQLDCGDVVRRPVNVSASTSVIV